MNLFNFFRRKAPETTRTHVVEVHRPIVDLKKETAGRFRSGMWIVVGDLRRTGIIKDLNEFGVASVMLTDAGGLNLLEVAAPLSELKQAKWKDIPEPRRPDALTARRLGYEVSP